MGEPSAVDSYLDLVVALLQRFRAQQRDPLGRAADTVAAAIESGGLLHLFGTGHSHMLAEEVFYRAGGMVAVDAMLDPSAVLSGGALRSTETERRSGSAAEIASRYDLRAGDVGVVISSSGRNPAPVEMALLMKERGLAVIAVTSLTHAGAAAAGGFVGRRLCEVAEVVLDTGVPYGDASLSMRGVAYPVGPVSTAVGAAVMQCLILAAMERLVARGVEVVNLPSGNVDGADPSRAMAEMARIRTRVRHL